MEDSQYQKPLATAAENRPGPTMAVRHFNEGDEVDAMSVAGEPFDMYERAGIRADVFTCDDGYRIPLIESDTPGSGTLDVFLDALRAALPDPAKPILFVNVINQRLRAHLERRGLRCIDDEMPDELSSPLRTARET